MKRGTPMRRTPFAHGTKPMRAKPKRASEAVLEAAAVFKIVVCSEPCIGTEISGHVCDGPLQAMHVVPKQTLRRRGLHDLVYDATNGVAGCYEIHRRHDSKVELIARELLPARCIRWAAEHNVLDALERHWPEATT